ILPSSIGIDKGVQKKLMVNAGFKSPKFFTVHRNEYMHGNCKKAYEKAVNGIGFPVVIKPATQGSSIGVSILYKEDEFQFMQAIEKALFTRWVAASEWLNKSREQKIDYVRNLADIREGIGMPLKINDLIIYHPADLIEFLDANLKGDEGFVLESLDGESKVLVEGFIEGKEFSCIVLQNSDTVDKNTSVIALPPTEIRKGKELFDYRSKYLPGLSRKITPIDLPSEQILAIRRECERLFTELNFDVYARIDGFISREGNLFLNDPNTTSGMMPSSFFFHQAAEIGLNPSQFLTYIIRTSLAQRHMSMYNKEELAKLLKKLDDAIAKDKNAGTDKIKVAVILGGYSSERHISVESGRNIYEKLASSVKYEPIPVFLAGNPTEYNMYQIPINILLKDNADDIKEKINFYQTHDVVKQIIKDSTTITSKYAKADNLIKPRQIDFEELMRIADVAFIALHGRPGEDGAIQEKLEEIGLPYNGSGIESSRITIDKYHTNEILKQNGFLIADHLLISEQDWNNNKESILTNLKEKITYPFIAKPVDDGCSSAVKKIKTKEEFEAFAKLIFRKQDTLDSVAAELLHIKDKEEFPQKPVILVEELVTKKDAKHFLEITGGMLTSYDKNGDIVYEVFEASEALSEGEVLSLEEKFLAGQGQNITPARYAMDVKE
ncbi:MAG TPA: D-alanine--D-alanine ligase, partial [Bacteroidia bacterium]|nr:D-alanine--D-alanine ligase [Bacteroidia bacterium]